jgi:high affinity Mn2+ porin
MKRILSYLLFCGILFLPCVSFAEKPITMDEMQKRLTTLEEIVARQQKIIEEYQKVQEQHAGTHKELREDKVGKVLARKSPGSVFAEPAMPGTLKIGANITALAQASPDTKLKGGNKQRKVGGSYQANVTITNEFSEIDGMALANLRIDQGDGIEDRLTVYSNVNNNAWNDDHFTLSEIFYEQRLFQEKLYINFGKLDPTVFFDQNNYAGSDTTQFLARIFNNSPVIGFPANSLGIRAGFYPYDWLGLDYLIMAGQSDLRNMDSSYYHNGEITFKTGFNGLSGNYRFLIWQSTVDHVKWGSPADNKNYAYGFSVSCDQEISDTIGIFAKFGWQDPTVYDPLKTANIDDRASLNTTPNIDNYSLEYMWSGGFQIKGKPWHRPYDFLGVAFGQAIASGDMKDSLKGTSNRRNARNESHFEAYYNFYMNKYLAVTPSVQLIFNPYGGDGDNDSVQVYTLRTHVDF